MFSSLLLVTTNKLTGKCNSETNYRVWPKTREMRRLNRQKCATDWRQTNKHWQPSIGYVA